ncbi:MAG: 30S ribosomal protein S8 [Polyangiaceae bacterium]
MMTDPISDMLTRIRNGALARHDRVNMPHSLLKERIAHVLKGEGFVDDVRVDETAQELPKGKRILTIVLRYGQDKGREKKPAIDGIRRVSSPGRRLYVAHDRIPRVCSGMGISILSTSRGVMTDKEARKQRVGGELLCEVW